MGPLIGHVAAISRFPVKSMSGESLEEAELGWAGIAGDRQWAFVAADRNSRFPWFTGRDHSPLVSYRAAYENQADPRRSKVMVTAPDGWSGAVDHPELIPRLEQASGRDVKLIQLGRGAFDAMPVSIVSSAGHAEVEAVHGMEIDPRRFRINLVVDTDFPLRVWAGRRLTFGEEGAAQVSVTAPIDRCVMITIDPETGERDPWLMRTIAQQFGNTYGVYANVVRPGALRMGAPVFLSD